MDWDEIAGDFNMWSQLEELRQKIQYPTWKSNLQKLLKLYRSIHL